jgi:hypothetical protein
LAPPRKHRKGRFRFGDFGVRQQRGMGLIEGKRPM